MNSEFRISHAFPHHHPHPRHRPRPSRPKRLRHPGNQKGRTFTELAKGRTNSDGRLPDLLPSSHILQPGTYRLTFDTDSYFTAAGATSFYPLVQITFTITDPGQHYHVPLLLSPYGYSTYRGS